MPKPDYVAEIRLLRHQRDGVCGRQVRVPYTVLGLPPFLAEEHGRTEAVCTVLAWVPQDHYLLALPSYACGWAPTSPAHSMCAAMTNTTATVHAGVCVPA